MTGSARIDADGLDKLFEPFDRTDAPGFAVGVALPGQQPYRRGFGMASIELPVALSPSIRMRIGSTTKHFCALAIMLLAEQGRLSLDDSPRRVLPELPVWADEISIQQLMAHTSGMRDSLDVVLHAAGPGLPAAPDMLFRLQASFDSVNAAPGSTWSYNNGGYVLLTEIIERLSRKNLGAFLTDNILRPAGLHDTMLRPLDTDLVPNSATLHVPAPDGGWMRGVFGPPIGGMGGLVSTVDDMLIWLRHLSQPVIGTPATWAAMRRPLTTHGYGLGLFMTSHRGLNTVHHAGGVVGGASQMLKVLDHELDIILMTNGRSGADLYRLVDDIIDSCIPDLPPIAALPADAAVTGTFHSSATGRVLAMGESKGKQIVTIGGMSLPALIQTDGFLSVPILPTDLRIAPIASDTHAALEITEFGALDRLEQVKPLQDTSLDDLRGPYANTATAVRAVIAIDDTGAPTLQLSCTLGPLAHAALAYALQPIGPDLWEAKAQSALPLVATLEFHAGGFDFTTGRTARLRFVRAG